MTRRHKETKWMAVALAVVLWACGDRSVTPPDVSQDAGIPVLMSRGGVVVTEQRMGSLLAKVTREVAIALADPAVRTMVYKELHASPYREHKLHFNTFLRGDARSLLSAMAAARATTPGAAPAPSADAAVQAAVLATLDTIVDLEFYMPVESHFAAWDGDANLIVASALRDDGRVPDGFDLAGRRVTLSVAEPPATPTLVIVPVETDFSRTPNPGTAAGVDAATSSIDGVYMTRQVIYSDHEGWPNGNPEFEVHLFQTDVDMEYIDQICAGEQREVPYFFNNDNQDWSGEVLLATEDRMALSPNNQFQVWEDDSQPCTLTGGRPPRADQATIGEYANWTSAILGITTTAGGNGVAIIKFLLNAVPASYNFFVDASDDPVGVLTLAAGCWPATGPANFRIYASTSGHPETGWATLDYRFAAAQRDPVCPQPPPPSLNVSITGPTQIRPGATCTWDAVVSNGTAPYSYSWYNNNMLQGSGPEYTGSKDPGNTDDHFAIRVHVTDATSAWGERTIVVYENSSAPICRF